MKLETIMRENHLEITITAFASTLPEDEFSWYFLLKQKDAEFGMCGIPAKRFFEGMQQICDYLAIKFDQSVCFEHITATPFNIEKTRAEIDKKENK